MKTPSKRNEQEEDYGMGKCPECGSKRYREYARGEDCDDCGHYEYYPYW